MPLYENSETENAVRNEHTYEMATGSLRKDCNSYEQPLSGSCKHETPPEGIYIEANPCALPNSSRFGIVTQRDRDSFEKLRKTSPTSNRLRLWVALLTVVVILCIGACISSVLLCLKATNSIKNYDEDILRLEEETQKVNDEMQQMQVVRSLELRKSLELYEWVQAQNGHWYKLFNVRTPYEDAKENCEALGTRLASFGMRNPERTDVILDDLLGGELWNIWIGLDSLQEENTWVWSDGVESTANNTRWKSGEPNYSNGNERCGHLSSSYRRPIVGKQCSRIYRYICETRNPM